MTVLNETIPLGEYIFLRICQANPKMKSIFGVPGDYNLNLMEHLYADSLVEQDVKFVGNCNELNAAYCSDGYARIMDTFSVMITTLGVGELSAMNGISSAFSEYSPILHIVGSIPIFKEQLNDKAEQEGGEFQNWHHLVQSKDQLSKPDPDVYMKMCEPISVVREKLELDMEENFNRIDNVINTILQESRPGYLFIPADLPNVKVPSSRLTKPFPFVKNIDEEKLNEFSNLILSKLYESKNPSIMSDDLITKFHSMENFQKIVNKVHNNKSVKLFSSRIGKNIDETLDNFVGIYPSPNKKVVESFQNSDCLIIFGYSNFETNALYNNPNHFKNIKTVIKINPDFISIGDKIFKLKSKGERFFAMNDLIGKLAEDLNVELLNKTDNCGDSKSSKIVLSETDTKESRVSQDKLFNFVNNYLQEDDIIMCETSSFCFALPDLTFKKNVRAIYNSYYASIGFALPACVGVSMAIKDLGRKNRVLLFEGDGSAQMTVQEISTFLRFNLTIPKIFLMNNEGYTIERAIMGEKRSYNDIQYWNWEFALKMFGDMNGDVSQYTKLANNKDFDNYFSNESNTDKLQLFEVMMYKTDYSQGLKFFLGK